MGLGQALTGFLTGFSERAAENISTRNKEIRDSIDEDLKKHAASVQADYAKKIKLRKQAYEHVSFLEANASKIPAFKNLSIQEKATLVTNPKMMKRLKDLSESPEGRRTINLQFSGTKKNNKPDHNSKVQTIEQAIDLRIPVEAAMPAPRVTRTKGAYGLTNTIEEDAIRKYAQQNPEYYSKPTVKPKTSVQMDKITLRSLKPADIRKSVLTTIQSTLEAGIAGDAKTYQYELKDPNTTGGIKSTTTLNRPQAKRLELRLKAEGIRNYVNNLSDVQEVHKDAIQAYVPGLNLDGTKEEIITELDEYINKSKDVLNQSQKQNQDAIVDKDFSSLSQEEADAEYKKIANNPQDHPTFYNPDGTPSAKFKRLMKRAGYPI